jgi:hypothetical protein
MAKENANKLVEESGMITHFKTTDILRKNGWSVLISPYYHDSISDSIRETDIIAEKQFNLSKDVFCDFSIQLNIQLFIECKYIKQEIAFWFDEINVKEEITNIEKEIDLNLAYEKSGDIEPKKFHHFDYKSAAKLFSTNSNKEDVIYKAMNQCLHSQINYRRTGKNPIFNRFYEKSFSKIVQYPVIVCDNFENLFEVKFDDKGSFSTEGMKKNFVLEANYRDDYFLIDVVGINYLSVFLKSIEEEAKSLLEAYRFKKDIEN